MSARLRAIFCMRGFLSIFASRLLAPSSFLLPPPFRSVCGSSFGRIRDEFFCEQGRRAGIKWMTILGMNMINIGMYELEWIWQLVVNKWKEIDDRVERYISETRSDIKYSTADRGRWILTRSMDERRVTHYSSLTIMNTGPDIRRCWTQRRSRVNFFFWKWCCFGVVLTASAALFSNGSFRFGFSIMKST